jgi:hypothetical protein
MPVDNHPSYFGESDLPSGARVQVWVPFTERWVPGFRVVAGTPRGYVVCRLSDRAVLNRLIPDRNVRLDPVPLPPTRWTAGNAA